MVKLLASVLSSLSAICVLFASSSSAESAWDEWHTDGGSPYDFVIVGGGTAGLALAARLSENPDQTVLVLEGGEQPDVVANYRTPGAALNLLGTVIDSGFVSIPQVTLKDRQITYHRGRTSGGSSAINGMVYGRGSSSIYNKWQELGNANWSWTDVFPLFRKSTSFLPQNLNDMDFFTYDPASFGNGPVPLTYPPWYPESSVSFIEAIGAIGVEPVQELTLGTNVGIKQIPNTITSDYQRSSSYNNYFEQAKSRPNLELRMLSQVRQIILEQQGSNFVATGVVYTDLAGGSTRNITAKKEVILSAGCHQTPQLLMLSGIGPQEILSTNGIPIYVANPNVGQNMQDHFYYSINVRVQEAASTEFLINDISRMQVAGQEYQQSHTGPLSYPGSGSTHGFQKLSKGELESLNATELIGSREDQAHIEYYWEPTFFPLLPTPQYAPRKNESYFSLTAGVLAPVARGNVSLQSNQIIDSPAINLNYMGAETDRRIAIEAFKRMRSILQQPQIQQWTIGPAGGEVSPGPAVQTDEEILEYILDTATTAYHAVGTCQMLPQDQGGVVDDRLRVYGVKGLRVVDSSIFPVVPDDHIMGPVYMVAEKAAIVIMEDWGL
ncbi:hypothetical protein PMZ80_010896 [Knufia obscura]|uniref:Uncharacterized protein n=1 Tax=Knufia obscura TaxID=1635080 RepID=A0ABR0R820_9EURO|nr:hypothetical protein PMZ80_010896 [Knufia obscura]